VSEPTVKRDLSKGRFSLRRLDQICAALDLTVADLIQPPEEQDLVTQLSEAQELALVSQPRYLVVTYLPVNDWKFREITETFRMDENELIEILLQLDRLQIIEYRPPHRGRYRRDRCPGSRHHSSAWPPSSRSSRAVMRGCRSRSAMAVARFSR
jgi:hypothetical protein